MKAGVAPLVPVADGAIRVTASTCGSCLTAYNPRNQLTSIITGPNGGSATASFIDDDASCPAERRLAASGQRRRGLVNRFYRRIDSLERQAGERNARGSISSNEAVARNSWLSARRFTWAGDCNMGQENAFSRFTLTDVFS
jgi:hypothetical protein